MELNSRSVADIDLNAMVLFAQVVDAQGISAAARLLGVPKSTVSRQMARLEMRLGGRLLQRAGRTVALTELGRRYYTHCARIAADAQDADLEVAGRRGEPSGTLRVSVPSAVHSLTGPWLSGFLQAFPQIRVELLATAQVLDLVREQIDCALRVGEPGDPLLESQALGVTRSVLCASPEYLATVAEPMTPQDLEQHVSVQYGLAPETHAWQLRRSKVALRVRPITRLACNELDHVRAGVLAGLGIAALPLILCHQDLATGRLRAVLPDWRLRDLSLHLVYPRRDFMPSRLQVFIEYAATWFARSPALTAAGVP